MIDFKLDENGDVVLDDNDVAMVENDDEIVQRLVTTLRTRLDEFEPADGMGLPGDNLFGKNTNPDYLEEDILDCINEQVDGIVDVKSIDVSEPDVNRNIDIKISFTTPNSDNITKNISLGGV